MDRFTKAMGKGDQDVMNLRSAIAGLVFENWSDENISAGVMEMVADCRKELDEVMQGIADRKAATQGKT